MKKLSKKQKLIGFIAIILVAVILAIAITENIVNRKIGNEGYLSTTANVNSNLVAGYIKKGITIGGITGTLESLNTFDATAEPEDILWGKTGYVKGKKITGTRLRQVDGVTIPYGFYYVGGRKDTGIVISDNKNDEDKYASYSDQANIPADGLEGNQFVWVPVENMDNFKRIDGYWDKMLEAELKRQIGDYNYWSLLSEPVAEEYGYESETEEYNAMYSSVEKNKGFYVARFEAGNDNGVVVSKKGIMPWSNIQWGDSMTEIGTTGAVARAKGMYTDKEKYGVTSTLIYGVQWDAIMSFIDPNYITSTCDVQNSFVANSAGKGNYSGTIAVCGSNDNYRVKNIYDLAGNVDENTMEASSTNNRVDRGGNWGNTDQEIPASARVIINTNNLGNTLRF